jgi:hypothetical protein
VAPPVDPPSPVEVDAPPPPVPPVAAERVPAPVTDGPGSYSAGSAAGDDVGAMPGTLDFLDGLGLDGVLTCVEDTVFRPGVGVINCATGAILDPIETPDLPVGIPADPSLPIDPILPIDPLP